MVDVMEMLKKVAKPNRVPEFQNTHPNPNKRIKNRRSH
jgi:predicted Zn-dependent protease